MAEPHQARRAAQSKHLAEQIGERREVATPEGGHGAEVRPLHAGHRHEVHALFAAARDPPRRVDAAAIGVKQQRHHHPRVVGRVAALLVERGKDGGEVQRLAHGVADEVREVPGRHQLARRGRQQPTLIHIPRAKGLRHP